MFQTVSANFRNSGKGLDLLTEKKWHGQIFISVLSNILRKPDKERLTIDLETALRNDSQK